MASDVIASRTAPDYTLFRNVSIGAGLSVLGFMFNRKAVSKHATLRVKESGNGINSRPIASFMYNQIIRNKGTLSILEYYPSGDTFGALVAEGRYKSGGQPLRDVPLGAAKAAVSAAATVYATVGVLTLQGVLASDVKKPPSLYNITLSALRKPVVMSVAALGGMAAGSSSPEFVAGAAATGAAAMLTGRYVTAQFTTYLNFLNSMPSIFNPFGIKELLLPSIESANTFLGKYVPGGGAALSWYGTLNLFYCALTSGGNIYVFAEKIADGCRIPIAVAIRYVLMSIKDVAAADTGGSAVYRLITRTAVMALAAIGAYWTFNDPLQGTSMGVFLEGFLLASELLRSRASAGSDAAAFFSAAAVRITAVLKTVTAEWAGNVLTPLRNLWEACFTFDLSSLARSVPGVLLVYVKLMSGQTILDIPIQFLTGMMLAVVVNCVENMVVPRSVSTNPTAPIALSESARGLVASTCCGTEMMAELLTSTYQIGTSPANYLVHLLRLTEDRIGRTCYRSGANRDALRPNQNVDFDISKCVSEVIKSKNAAPALWLGQSASQEIRLTTLHAAKLVIMSVGIPQLALLTTGVAVLEDAIDNGPTTAFAEKMLSFANCALVVATTAATALASTLYSLGQFFGPGVKESLRVLWIEFCQASTYTTFLSDWESTTSYKSKWMFKTAAQKMQHGVNLMYADLLVVVLVHLRAVMMIRRLYSLLTTLATSINNITRTLCWMSSQALYQICANLLPDWLFPGPAVLLPNPVNLPSSVHNVLPAGARVKNTSIEGAPTGKRRRSSSPETAAAKKKRTAENKVAADLEKARKKQDDDENRRILSDLKREMARTNELVAELSSKRSTTKQPAKKLTRPEVPVAPVEAPPISQQQQAPSSVAEDIAKNPLVLTHGLRFLRSSMSSTVNWGKLMNCLEPVLAYLQTTVSSDPLEKVPQNTDASLKSYCPLLIVPARLTPAIIKGILLLVDESLLEFTLGMLTGYTGFFVNVNNVFEEKEADYERTLASNINPPRDDEPTEDTVQRIAINCMTLVMQDGDDSRYQVGSQRVLRVRDD